MMNRWQQWFISIACILVTLPAVARPKIGLVLSGGGAKGSAHVAVLKVLEQQHIPIDYIAGTSIGAYVGGLYALGYSAEDIEKIMFSTDWDKGYSDIIPRQALSYRDKQQRDKYNVPLNLGYTDGKVTSPSGLIQGQTMSRLYRNSTGLVRKFKSFDNLAIPFRAVATDLATSHPVVIDSGSLVFAMQASATVPGALNPSVWHNKLLVDGGIANNMPVDVVKAMGADIVIAVDIGSSLASKDKLNSTVAVLNQLSTMLTNASTNKQKALLTDQDILIRPDVGEMSSTDFSVLPQAYQLGEKAAETLIPKLKTLSVPNREYQKYLLAKAHQQEQWIAPQDKPVTQIVLHNHSHVSDSSILAAFDIKKGDVVSKPQLDKAINKVYALNKFERVGAEFNDTEKGRILTLTTKAKSWGEDYFQLGLNGTDDYDYGSFSSLSLAYTQTNLTDNGAEWRNEITLGDDKQLASEWYQPLTQSQDWYFKSRYQFDRRYQGLFEDNDLTFGVDWRTHEIRTGLGYNLSHNAFSELGIRGLTGRIYNRALSHRPYQVRGYGGYLQLGYDRLNSISFPTQGDRLTFEVQFGHENLFQRGDESNANFRTKYKLDWKGALNYRHQTLVGKLALETAQNEVDQLSGEPAELGGFLNLSGFHKNSLLGNHKIFGALQYQYDLGRDLLGLTSYPLYLGVSAEAGNVWLNLDDVELSDLIYSSSLYLGTDTQFGPAALAFGYTDEGDRALYLFVGKNF